MGFWNRLFGRRRHLALKPKRLDYLNEALALERQGDYDAALTSYRLALRDHPADPRVLQNMAIAYTKTSQVEEAIRHYRRVLEIDPGLAGAHYGLGFLLLRRGENKAAAHHLTSFLERPPRGPDAENWPPPPAEVSAGSFRFASHHSGVAGRGAGVQAAAAQRSTAAAALSGRGWSAGAIIFCF